MLETSWEYVVQASPILMEVASKMQQKVVEEIEVHHSLNVANLA